MLEIKMYVNKMNVFAVQLNRWERNMFQLRKLLPLSLFIKTPPMILLNISREISFL